MPRYRLHQVGYNSTSRNLKELDIILDIWVNYINSPTWIKAIWGWFPLFTMIPVRSQWGRYNLPSWHLLHWTIFRSEINLSTVFLQSNLAGTRHASWGWGSSRMVVTAEQLNIPNIGHVLKFLKWGSPKSPVVSIQNWSNDLDDLRSIPF